MQTNDNKIMFQSPHKNMKKSLLLSQSNAMGSNQKKYFKRKLINQRSNCHTQNVFRKQVEVDEQRKQHAKSGFILSRKDIISTQKINEFRTNPSVNSIFKRRVHSQSKVKSLKAPLETTSNTQKSQSKINFAKKLIEDLKKATFTLKKNPIRYSSSPLSRGNILSKSFDNNNSKNKIIHQNRQKLTQKSIQKLKPSFYINEVKFYDSKQSIRKLSRQSSRQSKNRTVRINNSKLQENRVSKSQRKQQRSQNKNEYEQILQKTIKKSSQSLVSYSEFINSSTQNQYKINVDYLLQYTTPKQKSQQSILSQIDFSALKLLASIYLCLVDILQKLLEKLNFVENKKNLQFLTNDSEVVKQYVQVYFHTYSRMKVQFIICEVIFKKIRSKLYEFFIMQRMIMYWLHNNFATQSQSIRSSSTISSVKQFFHLSQQINKNLINILYEEMGSHVIKQFETQKQIVDNLRVLRLAKELEKRQGKLKKIVDGLINEKQVLICYMLRNDRKNENIVHDYLIALIAMGQKLEKNQNSNMIQLYKLQQYFNWTLLKIPPLFYLPLSPSKPYTLVIDLDGTLIHYNQQTKILKYRPYMDRFLISMKKHFQLIIFSSHPKQRTDIIVQQIERDQRIFQFRLYRSHMVFQQGGLRKNVGYLGRSLQKIILVDDEDKNTEWLPLNSYKIQTFTGDKKDKQLLHLSDWLTSLIQTQPVDIRGKLKQPNSRLEEVLEVDEASSTIQASIDYYEKNETTRSSIKKK